MYVVRIPKSVLLTSLILFAVMLVCVVIDLNRQSTTQLALMQQVATALCESSWRQEACVNKNIQDFTSKLSTPLSSSLLSYLIIIAGSIILYTRLRNVHMCLNLACTLTITTHQNRILSETVISMGFESINPSFIILP